MKHLFDLIALVSNLAKGSKVATQAQQAQCTLCGTEKYALLPMIEE